MERYKKAGEYHARGFNCCQCVLAAFGDLTGLDEQTALDLGGGFGGGAGTGELCGAISGAVMVLGLLTPVDPSDPVGSKKRTVALSRKVQERFKERFGALRCRELLKAPIPPESVPASAKALGLTGHCDNMILAAVELVEQILAERKQ